MKIIEIQVHINYFYKNYLIKMNNICLDVNNKKSRWKNININDILTDNIQTTIYMGIYEEKNIIIKKSYLYSDDIDIFNNEVNHQKLSHSLGYSPEIYDSWKCKNDEDYIIVMDYIKGKSYTSFFKLRNYNIVMKIFRKLLIMVLDLFLLHNISHGDLHTDNIIVNYENDKQKDKQKELYDLDVKIIDFGSSKNFKDKSLINKNKEYYVLFEDLNKFIDFDDYSKIKIKKLLTDIFKSLTENVNFNEDIDKESIIDAIKYNLQKNLKNISPSISENDINYIVFSE